MMGNQHLFVDVLPGFPAAEAGIKIGDELIGVDGITLSEVDEDLIPEMLQGASGTDVSSLDASGMGMSAPAFA